jgi:hypothetical protein
MVFGQDALLGHQATSCMAVAAANTTLLVLGKQARLVCGITTALAHGFQFQF